jgi:hypothetical protein
MAVKRWNGTTWDIYAGADTSPGFAATDGRSGRRTYVGANTPTAPVDGDIWIDQDTATNAIPASAFDAKGDLMVGTGPDTYTRQAVGTDGQVLVADSSQADGVLWSHNPSRQGLVNIVPTSVAVGSGSASTAANGGITFSGASSVSLNGCFTSAYSHYKIMFDCTGTNLYNTLKVRANGVDEPASSYFGSGFYLASTSFATYYESSLSAAKINWVTSDHISISVDVFNPALAKRTHIQANATGLYAMSMFNSLVSNTSTYDGFTITNVNAASGTIRVYGYGNGA